MRVGDPRMHGKEILECGGMCMEGDPKIVSGTLECVGADPECIGGSPWNVGGKTLEGWSDTLRVDFNTGSQVVLWYHILMVMVKVG
mgnify:CR=1 FL=1